MLLQLSIYLYNGCMLIYECLQIHFTYQNTQAFKWKEESGKEFLNETLTHAFYRYCNRKYLLFK